MPERLVLWDIDGTLVRAGNVAKNVFAVAVEHVVGTHPGEHGVVMGGKTDPQIALEILAGMGIDARTGEGHLPVVVERLEAELACAVELILERGRVLPGAAEVLAALHADPSVLQSVLTGNTAANAATKLAAFGLERWLDVEIGAFGSDDRERRALVPVALRRASEQRGWEGTPDDVWVVGDTPNDLACARAGGVRCALVGTGHTPVDELARLGPDAVLDDLSDVETVVKLLTA